MATVFFSYSHKDETLRDELEVHLAGLQREGLIEAWHDRRILAGDSFDASISDKLDTADIVLLLISPDFLASRYCYEIEMQRALDRHAEGKCRVIAVILRPCDWQQTPFAKLLAVPTDGKPVTKWPDRDDAFLDIVKQIRRALPKTHASAPSPKATSQQPVSASMPRSSNLRLRKTFTEADKDRFLDESFEFIANFFEGSLSELKKRNPDIDTRFKRIDATAFGAVVYRNGRSIARCGIRHGGGRRFTEGITYSADDSAPPNSMNEWLSVSEGEHELYLKTGGMSRMFRQQPEGNLTVEGAAEFLWSLLIEPLQSEGR